MNYEEAAQMNGVSRVFGCVCKQRTNLEPRIFYDFIIVCWKNRSG